MKYWEIIADRLSEAGWTWGYCSAYTPRGLLFYVDCYRDGERHIVHSDDLLGAFVELEQATSSTSTTI